MSAGAQEDPVFLDWLEGARDGRSSVVVPWVLLPDEEAVSEPEEEELKLEGEG